VATRVPVESREQAFERLYKRYVGDVYRYALAVLRNTADAEDVTQTTFLNAYRAFKNGEEPRKPQNWLIKIAHNACRTRAIRAARRPREVPLEGREAVLAVPELDRPDVTAVLEALGRLPFNQRAALVMRELEGRSYEDIAEALGVSGSAVETLIFRARRSLRLKRDAFRGLATVPLPASLHSFGGSAAATGGAAAGTGVATKLAAVAAALLAGGAGYQVAHRDGATTTRAAKPQPAARPVLVAAALTPAAPPRRLVAAVARAKAPSARAARPRGARTIQIRTFPVSKRPLVPSTGGGESAEPAPAPQSTGGSGGSGSSRGDVVATTTAPTTATVVGAAQQVVAAVPVEVPSVQVPVPEAVSDVAVPAVTVPSVTVPVPDVPAPPGVPSVAVPPPPPAAAPVALP
jgi:RNA polymerase sigma factor (sigma-70 family)